MRKTALKFDLKPAGIFLLIYFSKILEIWKLGLTSYRQSNSAEVKNKNIMAKNVGVRGSFTAINPQDGKRYDFKMEEMGWISVNGVFHFSNRKPQYAKDAAKKLFLNSMKFITGYYNG